MRRILLAGMSGTGKSSALTELEKRGFQVVDTDEGGWSEWSDTDGGYVWREDRIEGLLDRELILRHVADVEPLLRATCTHELDATQPLDIDVEQLVAIGLGPEP